VEVQRKTNKLINKIMGINSTEVAYGFGQFGCAITDSTALDLKPPKDLVIVAITALSDLTFDASGGLVAELATEALEAGADRPGWISTEHEAHGFGEVVHTDGAVITGHNNNGNADHDTGEITLSQASSLIKPGMIVESITLCPASDTDPFVVLSHDGATTAEGLVIAKQSNPTVAVDHAGNVASSDAESLFFYHPSGVGHQGQGGLEMDASDTIPKGVTIYGRWTKMNLAGGRAIAYFGK
jgi:hypothetical protein